uniref:hypothetical protein n=1 Tax=Elizabethkingia meningoseptica TaxID=238 RepID=UPI00163ABFD2
MLDQKLVEETIQDLQEVKEKILNRHEGDTTLTLRFDSVFNSLINSLGNTTGNIVSSTSQKVSSGFTPKPLTNIAGQKISGNSSVLKLQPLEVDQAKAFKEEIQAIHDSFSNRENGKLLEELNELQIRGVAKVAGVEDYDTDPINGDFVQKIKDKIAANVQDKADREKSKEDLKNQGNETQKPTEK